MLLRPTPPPAVAEVVAALAAAREAADDTIWPNSSKAAYFPHPFPELGLDGVPNPNLDSHGHARIY